MQPTMLSFAGSGGTRKALTKELISNYRVPKPTLSEQQRIANTLTAYDDLMENNQRADPLFVHAAINSDERKRQLLSYAQKGSTRKALTKETVSNFEITIPTDALMRQFGEIAGDAFRQREILAQQTQKLRTARDLLLPRLMSGEIAV